MGFPATSLQHDLASRYPVSAAQVEFFRTQGHVCLPALADRREVEGVLPAIDRVLSAVTAKSDSQGRIEDYSSLFQQVTNVWRLDESVRAFVFARRFARVAADLMGVDGVRLYHDQALYKPAGGKLTPWHQDQFYWPLDTHNTITLWMPLIDLPRTMGTMLFACGSHLQGALLDRSISEESNRGFARLVEEKQWPVESYDMKAGDATFHAGWAVHSAHPNTSGHSRKVLTVIYYADGAKVVAPENDFRKTDMEVFLPGCRPGEPAASPLNPLLFTRGPDEIAEG
jgi:ectoine hydroxylase-related dioxygenase (phytanoyl-CoA dioxygenase family)